MDRKERRLLQRVRQSSEGLSLLQVSAVASAEPAWPGAPLMNRIGITDFRARGFAVGIAAHGIGTARAFQVDAVAGVFAGIAMSLKRW